MSMKNPVTPAGVEPATFRFLAGGIIISKCVFKKWDKRKREKVFVPE